MKYTKNFHHTKISRYTAYIPECFLPIAIIMSLTIAWDGTDTSQATWITRCVSKQPCM